MRAAERMQREKSPKEVRDWLAARCAQTLATYREKCSDNAPAGQLILPEALKLLPLYINCILKHDSIAGGERKIYNIVSSFTLLTRAAADMSVDDRAWLMQLVPSMRVDDSVHALYPRCINVLDAPDSVLDDDFCEVPMLTRYSTSLLQIRQFIILV